jgi:hypothetical protein
MNTEAAVVRKSGGCAEQEVLRSLQCVIGDFLTGIAQPRWRNLPLRMK